MYSCTSAVEAKSHRVNARHWVLPDSASNHTLESDWDPRVLLTLETRMEHGKHWSAAEAAEVP